MTVARLASIALDCSEPAGLAEFWAQLLGGDVAYTSEEFCAVKTDSGWLATVRVPDYRPPTWPDARVPKQMHLDLATEDLDAAEAEAIRLGARKADEQPGPDRWRVLLDPAGHPFCVSSQIPD
jgi:nucleotide-binding universal stress UspA family protein